MSQVFAALAHQLQAGDVVMALVLMLLVSAGLTAAFAFGFDWSAAWPLSYARFAWQIGALLGLEQAYELTRGRIPHETDVATLNAYRVLDFEWRHGIFVEARIQHFFLQFKDLMIGIDLFYMLGHLFVTIGVVAWVYIWRRETYPLARNLMMLVTALALIVYYVYPAAPPRMLTNYGFVDPAVLNHLAPAGGDQADSYTYNPYAAMPSLHVAYALVVATVLFAADHRWWLRMLAAAYPIAMAADVIITGNHWLLDVLGACITVAVSVLLLRGMGRISVRARAAVNGHPRRRASAVAELPAT